MSPCRAVLSDRGGVFRERTMHGPPCGRCVSAFASFGLFRAEYARKVGAPLRFSDLFDVRLAWYIEPSMRHRLARVTTDSQRGI